jgi:AGZA family xanthine/uracil permease-like MFS transporter
MERDFFSIKARGSTPAREVLAALTTFATMAYVLAVHPMIMADAGMDRAEVITVTALVAGVASILMGLMANVPIAQAPGMGSNGLVAYTLILGMGVPWQGALGLVFWSGVFFLLLTLTGIRKILLDAYPGDLKRALTAGIGLFIMFIGLKSAGIVLAAPAPILLQLGNLAEPAVLLAVIGIPLTLALLARGVPGAILGVILLLTVIAFFLPHGDATLAQPPDRWLAPPESPGSLWLALDPGYLRQHIGAAFPALMSLIFIDLFSSLAAANAVCRRAGLTDEQGNMNSPIRVLSADALATIGASLAGTTTTNVYGESASGVESGGRTGLVAIIVGLLFLMALFIHPLLVVIPPQATAPALVVVGLIMFSEAAEIDFSDPILGGSAAITILLMAVTSISDGMAIGLMVYVAAMLLLARWREVHWMSYLLALCFAAYFFVR